jgi:CRISP-associated protein Cas1
MIKKSILIENKSSVTCKNLQLIIKNEAREASIPIEDIGFLVIDNPEVYISITALNLLVENNASLIICNKTHLPKRFTHFYYKRSSS